MTVPVLFDKERRTIVSNESAEIIRMMNSAFDGVGATLTYVGVDGETVSVDLDVTRTEVW